MVEACSPLKLISIYGRSNHPTSGNGGRSGSRLPPCSRIRAMLRRFASSASPKPVTRKWRPLSIPAPGSGGCSTPILLRLLRGYLPPKADSGAWAGEGITGGVAGRARSSAPERLRLRGGVATPCLLTTGSSNFAGFADGPAQGSAAGATGRVPASCSPLAAAVAELRRAL